MNDYLNFYVSAFALLCFAPLAIALARRHYQWAISLGISGTLAGIILAWRFVGFPFILGVVTPFLVVFLWLAFIVWAAVSKSDAPLSRSRS